MQQEKQDHMAAGFSVRTDISAGKGLGDHLMDFNRATGIEKLAHLYTEITGKDCGCEQRRQKLNEWFPNI